MYLSYEMLLSPHRKSEGSEVADLLDQNLIVYNEGYRFWIDQLTSILGGYSPEINLSKPFADSFDETKFFKEEDSDDGKKSSKKAQKPNKPTNPDSLSIPREVFAFTAWFRLETRSEAVKSVDQNSLFSRFKEYWGSQPFNEEVIRNLCEFSIRKNGNAIWVDRRACFYHLNKKLKITKEQLSAFFADKSLPLASTAEANQYCRNFLSKAWGNGKKINRGVYDAYRNFLGNANWDGSVADLVNFASALPKLTGRDPKFKLLLKDIEAGRKTRNKDKDGNPIEITCYRIKDELQKWIKDREKDFEVCLHSQEWVKNLKCMFEDITGISYQQPKRLLLGECNQFLTTAWETIRSSHTKIFNALAEKIKRQKEVEESISKPSYKKYLPVVAEFCRHMEKTHDYDDYSFRPQQVGGVEELLTGINNGEEPSDVIKDICENNTIRSNPNFLQWLISNRGNVARVVFDNKPSTSKNGLRTVAKVHYAKSKLARLNMPRLSYPDKNNPQWPEFNGNFGSFKLVATPIEEHFYYNEAYPNDKYGIGIKKGNDHKVASKIVLSLFDKNKELHEVEIPVVGKRAVREVLYQMDGVPRVSRNHPLVLDQRKVESPINSMVSFNEKGESKELSICLFHRNRNWNQTNKTRWHMKISINGNNKKWEKQKLVVGQRCLGIDLGTRNWASYGVIEIVSKSHKDAIPLCDHKGNMIAHAISIETGKVEGRNPKTNIDVLNDRSRLAEKSDYNLANAVLSKFVDSENHMISQRSNTTLAVLFKILARKWRKNVSENCPKGKKGSITNEMYNHFLDILDLILPSESSGRLWGGYYGGLTYERIELLEELRRCNNAIISRTSEEESNSRIVIEANNRKEQLSTKIAAVKKERIRLLVNQIIRLANTHNCCAIVAEDLENMMTDSSSRKFFNRLLSHWCPQGIFKQLKEQCISLEIPLMRVLARNSSHYDWADKNQWKPRLWKITKQELSENRSSWRQYFRRVLKKDANRSSGNNYTAALRKLMELDNINSVDELMKNLAKRDYTYVPKYAGHFYLSSCSNEPMLADESAALCIATRGIMYIVSRKEKTPAKTTVEQKQSIAVAMP